MNWYHITVSGFSGSSQGLVLFSLQVVTPEKPGLGVPAHLREWRCFQVPPKPKQSVIPWLCCLRPGVCWGFHSLPYCVMSWIFQVFILVVISIPESVLWSWCPVLPALPQWQELGFVWSERTDNLDFGGVCVPGLILAYSNVKLQPSVPCVPLENKMLMLSGFRGSEEKSQLKSCPAGRLGSKGRARCFSQHIPCECPGFPCPTFNLNTEFPGGLDSQFVSQFGGRWEGSWRTGCVQVHVAPPAWRWQILEGIGKTRGAGQLGGCQWVWWEEFWFLSFYITFQLLNSTRIQRSALNSSGYSLLVLNLLLVSYEKYTFFLCCTVRRKLFCCLQ